MRAALLCALSGLGAARQLAEAGPTHDRMVMIEAYLAQFGLKNLSPLSMTFDSGKVEVHGEASAFRRPRNKRAAWPLMAQPELTQAPRMPMQNRHLRSILSTRGDLAHPCPG